ncbi:spermatogenesis-associated protein 33 isoform X2 [Mus musculus]|uniref:spermatogenesis-associated protein 33 isoform X2 n=1 Tax=Mus musculus TaxID=10090 RepID=UPI0005ABABA1|nr:spermatogenesis-associated protein 33 isoform X2 [Mus musculus]|eukprot:XP_011246710.1 PREDICTED: spermatogenesis-associated protein 33 isoform X2 [Mus musculus]
MGQSKSKPREKKEEEKSTTTLVTKSKEKVMEKEAKQSDKESQPAESLLFATSKHSRPSSSSEVPWLPPVIPAFSRLTQIPSSPAAQATEGGCLKTKTNLRQSKGQARREVSSRRSSSPGPPTRR